MPVNSRFSYQLVLKDHGADIDLSKYLMHMQYVETGNEEVSNATIKLNSHFGRFIKDNKIIGGTTFPAINHFDRIYLRLNDPLGADPIEDVLEVVNFKPIEKGGINTAIELQCDNQGWHFNNMHFSLRDFGASGFSLVNTFQDIYNENTGSDDPVITSSSKLAFNSTTRIGNALSTGTSNIWDYGNSEIILGDGLQTAVDRLGASVDAGGELEFFDWRFLPAYDHSTGNDLNQMHLSIAVSGNTSNQQTIDKAESVSKLTELEGEFEPEKGTNQWAWGDANAGTLPTGTSIYFGRKEKFLSANEWDGNFINYLKDMRVQYDGNFYKALIDHTSSPGTNPSVSTGSLWTNQGNIFTSALAGVEYGQLTKDKPEYWINNGGGYIYSRTTSGDNEFKAAQIDHNLVIRDQGHHRTWVDILVDRPDVIAGSLLIGGTDEYEGLRVLVPTSSTGGVFALNGGNDRFGKAYGNAVVKRNKFSFTGSEEYKNWDVFRTAQNDDEIYDFRTGQSWTYKPYESGFQIDGTGVGSRSSGWVKGRYFASFEFPFTADFGFRTNDQFDCAHPYDISGTSPFNPAFASADGVEGGSGTPGNNSGVGVTYTFATIFDDIKTLNAKSRVVGAWLNFAFPYPRSGDGTAWGSPNVGEQYVNPFLDQNNMTLTSDGKRGYNRGLASEDFGTITGVKFWTKLFLEDAVFPGNPALQGNFQMRCCLWDDNDSAVVSDFTISHNDNYEEVFLPISSFKVFRARTGLANIPTNEIEIQNVFDWRKVVRGAIFTLDSYDDEGRYNPFNRFVTTNLGRSITLTVDALHFTKPLLVTSQESPPTGTKPSRNIEPPFLQRPNISNYEQLKNDVKSQLEIAQFKKKGYRIKRPLRTNVRFGETFTLRHPRVVEENGTDEIDLVCKKNIYTITKAKGSGGFQVETIGVKRPTF